MKRLSYFILLIWASVAMQAQDSLPCARLDSLLQAPMFETSTVGMMVYDLEGDSVIFKKNERQLLRPASTMKLVTAITALDRLGGDHPACTGADRWLTVCWRVTSIVWGAWTRCWTAAMWPSLPRR